LAGKTGTTNYPLKEDAIKDAWFVGYTPTVVGAVWMGYDHTDQEHYLKSGSTFPTKLFKDILEKSSLPKEVVFSQPEDVTELEPPIRLADVSDLTGSLTFKPLGLFTVKLNWTPSSDERVEYRVYEERETGDKLVGTVKGVGTYELENVNIFSLPSLYVVPYNPLTEEEGLYSNRVKPEFFSKTN